MKKLPSFTVLLCLGVASTVGTLSWLEAQDAPAPKPATVAGPSTAEGEKPKLEKTVTRTNEASGTVALISLQDARDRLLTYKSIKAKLVETVAIGDRRFRMEGNYVQGAELKIRLEYAVMVGNTNGKLLEVCDGRLLWTHQQIGRDQRVTRRDVRQILDAAGATERSSQDILNAELGLGGLAGLLAAIQNGVQFEKQWEQSYDDQPFVVIDGTWKSEQRAKFLGADAKPDQPLPLFVPDRVRVYFQKEGMFPRRFMYLKKVSDGKGLRPLVTIDLTEVVWNEEVDDALFKFTPPENVERQDVTDSYLKFFGKGKDAAPAAVKK